MKRTTIVALLALALPAGAFQEALSPEAPDTTRPLVWDETAAEHLLNRAGFGARPLEIRAAVRMGHEAFVDSLFAEPREHSDPYYARNYAPGSVRAKRMEDMESVKQRRRTTRAQDRNQLSDFGAWWVERMLSGEDPLREKMTLFWHGHFTSSMDDVKNSYEMIVQNRFLHDNALGSFEDLVKGIARDPAMLEYLDNDSNVAQHPNENFARELMELFTLGEGNYTEEDVKEAARAFTGWSDGGGKFRFRARKHDDGEKTVLGRTGAWDGDDVIDILLEQDVCAEYMAGRIIGWFEGLEPEPARRDEYAAFLRENEYAIGRFLRRLFLDPDFYRDEVVGTRIAGPVELMVGTSRRLGIQAPPQLVVIGSRILGQRLFHPPNVKGWEEGAAWITTSTLMQRGNFAGLLVGEVSLDDILEVDVSAVASDESDMEVSSGMMEDDAMDPVAAGELRRLRAAGGLARPTDARKPPKRKVGSLGSLKRIKGYDWSPRLNLTARLDRLGARNDGKIVNTLLDELLGVEPAPGTRAYLVDFVKTERQALGIRNGKLLSRPSESEPLLRRMAHLILSLPEAQLN
ncbi:MAG: DUF1800 domain-containing protein [Planctomycetota bacterium]|nr:DUF1800 domain-containing protein [Planctomycetota bacterium]